MCGTVFLTQPQASAHSKAAEHGMKPRSVAESRTEIALRGANLQKQQTWQQWPLPAHLSQK